MQQRSIFKHYNFQGPASGAYTYIAAHHQKGQGTIVTSGSSTTVTSGNLTQAFSQAAVGDQIKTRVNKVTYRRYIATKASNDSVTVDTALSIPAPAPWYHLRQVGGITDADGWINVQGLENKLLYIQINTLGSAAGISYSVETRGAGDNSTPRQIIAGTLTAAVVAGTTNPLAADVVVIAEAMQDIRVGVKNANDGADNVSCWITGELRR
jgi:hypothetical protein